MSATLIPRFLRQLRDVQLTTPADGEILTYEASSAKFKNKPGGSASSLGVINVLDPPHGAKGDGVTDDTQAIQSALNTASSAATSAGGGARMTVLVPGGRTYRITYRQDRTYNQRLASLTYSACLILPPNVELIGVGKPRLLADQTWGKVPGLIAATIIATVEGGYESDGITQTLRSDNCTIRGLVLDGGFVADGYGSGIAFPDASEDYYAIDIAGNNVQIIDNKFVGNWGDAIWIGNVPGFTYAYLVADNYFTICNGQAINVLGNGTTQGAVDSAVHHNICYDSQAAGGGGTETIMTQASVGTIVEGNICEKWGMIEALGPGNRCIGNIIRPITGGLQYAMVGANGVFDSNLIDLDAYDAVSGVGIYVDAFRPDATVTNNTVIIGSGGGGGMDIRCDRAIIKGNHVVSATGSPITGVVDLQATGTDSIVEGNVLVAGAKSLTVNKAKVSDNVCARYLEVGASVGGATVRDNTFVASGAGPAIVVYRGDHHFEGNRLDGSAATSGWGPVWFRDQPDPGGSIFRGNTIMGAGVVNLLAIDGGRQGGDVFQDNIISGGTLNLDATMVYKRSKGGLVALTYSTPIATDANLGDYFTIVATDTSAYTISNPTNAQKSMEITYDIKNSAGGGGSMGTITWGNLFKLAGAFTNPADTKQRTITFRFNGTNWVEISRAGADI